MTLRWVAACCCCSPQKFLVSFHVSLHEECNIVTFLSHFAHNRKFPHIRGLWGSINTANSINAGRCCVTFGCEATEGACLSPLTPHSLFIHLISISESALRLPLSCVQPWPCWNHCRRYGLFRSVSSTVAVLPCSPEACEYKCIAISTQPAYRHTKKLIDN